MHTSYEAPPKVTALVLMGRKHKINVQVYQAPKKQISIGPAGQGWIDVGTVCKACLLGGSGGMPPSPRKILDFRPSEIVSGAILG